MPEYLTPGVYVEETSFRARSIEGVPTSTFGMAGRAQYGPVPYSLPGLGLGGGAGGPKPGPTLLTSYTEYERAFGGLSIGGEPCWLAFAARAFFSNGGRRLYVSRVVDLTMAAGPPPAVDVDANFASLPVPPPPPGGGAAPAPLLRFRARWPGSVARTIRVVVSLRRSKNRLINGVLTGVRPGAAVEVLPLPADGSPFTPPPDTQDPDPATVQVVVRNDEGELGYRTAAGGFQAVDPATAAVHLVLAVSVSMAEDRVDAYNELELDEEHPRSIFTVLQLDDPPDEFSLVWLGREPVAAGQPAPTPGAGGDGVVVAAGLDQTRGEGVQRVDPQLAEALPLDPDPVLGPGRQQVGAVAVRVEVGGDHAGRPVEQPLGAGDQVDDVAAHVGGQGDLRAGRVDQARRQAPDDAAEVAGGPVVMLVGPERARRHPAADRAAVQDQQGEQALAAGGDPQRTPETAEAEPAEEPELDRAAGVGRHPALPREGLGPAAGHAIPPPRTPGGRRSCRSRSGPASAGA